jgi:hypothetical protein
MVNALEAEHRRNANDGRFPNFEPLAVTNWPSKSLGVIFFSGLLLYARFLLTTQKLSFRYELVV